MTVNWKRESVEELREYEAKRAAAGSLPDEIDGLMADIGRADDGTGHKGGTSEWKDRQINRIVACRKLEASLACVKRWVADVERGLAALNEEERLILEYFYINPEKGGVDGLCRKLYLEKTAIYERKDAALRTYTLARYGCTEG